VHERAWEPDPPVWLTPGVAGLPNPRIAVMSDALRRVHGSGMVAEVPPFVFDVGEVEDADPEGFTALGAVEEEPHAPKVKAIVTIPAGSSRLNMG
jgi:hypothetical protein